MDLEQVKRDFVALEPRASRLLSALIHEIGRLLGANDVALGVPIEGRVKTWQSIQEKLERKSLRIDAISDLNDLVGVRLILLFRSDLESVLSLLANTFKVLSVEDASLRLGEAQFGYQSQHLLVQLPSEWAGLPSLSDLTSLQAEIQVRTVAQHIWAAASHKLQYKQEEGVPPPLRRTIFRISALLETVDLELNRVLEERQAYLERATPLLDETLNVDLLSALLNKALPAGNKDDNEDYADLLQDLLHFGVKTEDAAKVLWAEQQQEVLSQESVQVERSRSDRMGTTLDRVKKGVYFTHVGLMRIALSERVGDEAFAAWAEEKKSLQGSQLASNRSVDHRPARTRSFAAPKRT